MELKDDRDEVQQAELWALIGGVDSVMSGWGKAEGGTSYAYWACEGKNADTVKNWVEARGDIGPVERRQTAPPGGPKDHCHIYCVDSTHPALQGES